MTQYVYRMGFELELNRTKFLHTEITWEMGTNKINMKQTNQRMILITNGKVIGTYLKLYKTK